MSIVDTILSKDSWGSKQALSSLGVVLPKTNCSKDDVLEIVFKEEIERFDALGPFLDELCAEVRKLNPTFSKATLKTTIRGVWDFYHKDLVNCKEVKLARHIIVTVVDRLPESVGRNIFKRELFILVLNNLEKYGGKAPCEL